MIQFTIPIKPCVKKNSQQIVMVPIKKGSKRKRPMIIQSAAYRQYEKDCEKYIPNSKIDYPVNIKAIFYMPSRRRVDLSNLLEGLHDIMTKYNCIEDDNCNIIYSVDGSRVLYDKENPRTEIEITKLDVTTIRDL